MTDVFDALGIAKALHASSKSKLLIADLPFYLFTVPHTCHIIVTCAHFSFASLSVSHVITLLIYKTALFSFLLFVLTNYTNKT